MTLLTLRSVLTVVTQATFIICISSRFSNVAWPILNSAGLFAMWLSMWFLKDTLNRPEIVVIASITTLNLARLLWV